MHPCGPCQPSLSSHSSLPCERKRIVLQELEERRQWWPARLQGPHLRPPVRSPTAGDGLQGQLALGWRGSGLGGFGRASAGPPMCPVLRWQLDRRVGSSWLACKARLASWRGDSGGGQRLARSRGLDAVTGLHARARSREDGPGGGRPGSCPQRPVDRVSAVAGSHPRHAEPTAWAGGHRSAGSVRSRRPTWLWPARRVDAARLRLARQPRRSAGPAWQQQATTTAIRANLPIGGRVAAVAAYRGLLVRAHGGGLSSPARPRLPGWLHVCVHGDARGSHTDGATAIVPAASDDPYWR